MSVIYLAGGCFWGVQKYFDQFEGIIKTTVGYANGHTENPKYEELCRRFLADSQDFSEEKIEESGIEKRFQNINLDDCVKEIIEYIKSR